MKSIFLSILAMIALAPAFAHADSPVASDDIGCVSYVRGNRSAPLEDRLHMIGMTISYALFPDAKGSDIGIGVHQLFHGNSYAVDTLLLSADTQADEQLVSLPVRGTVCLKGIPSQVDGYFYVFSAKLAAEKTAN